MDAGARRKAVGAGLLTIILGTLAVAITDFPHGIVTAAFVAAALVVAQNL
jgi:hypothetical protein